MKYFLYLMLFSSYAFGYQLKVNLLQKGTKLPVKEVNVFVLPEKLKKITDLKGSVYFEDIQSSEVEVVVAVPEFIRQEKKINLDSERSQKQSGNTSIKFSEVTLYLEKESESTFETVITDTINKRDQSKKTVSRQQFLQMPGANGDPLKAVQNLPGVNRTQGFSSQVVIQGSAPKDTAYDFEGHEIPIVFHFGGLSSVVMPEAVEQVDYFSAGYQVDYSRALGGIISLKTRQPDVKERSTKSLFYLDNLSAGGLLETRLSDTSSLLISGRYSYIGFFLKNAVKNSSELDLTVAPEFQDITAVYQNDLSETQKLKLSFLASKDKLAFVFNEPLRGDPTIRGQFSNLTQFYRFVPSYTQKIDANSSFKLSLGLGQDELGVEVGDQYFRLKSSVLTPKAEYENQVSELWKLYLGWDNQYSDTQVSIKLPLQRSEGGVSNPISASATRTAQISAKTKNIGLYINNELKLNSDWTLYPGLRFDRFSQTQESFILPRFAGTYKATKDLLWKWGSGLYVQPPEPQESSADFGNPDIKSPKAVHFTFGFEKDTESLIKGSNLSLSFFDRWYDQLVIQSSGQTLRQSFPVYEIYNNNGRGRSYGLEAQWKLNQTDYQGFLSYTFSKSTRWNSLQSEYPFEYDQTHNVNLVMAKPLSANWKISGRFRYVTGNPKTPIQGATYDSDNEVYFPTRGSLYSQRMKDFYQLDMRLDKKWINEESIWTVYLDIQNVLNIKNPESIQYSYDYQQKQEVTGLPILPAIGVKGEF